LNSALSGTQALSGFSSGLGQTNSTLGSNWNASILGGDTTKIATALAPAISAGQQGVQQQKNQIAQFGNRSGGNTAKAASLDAANRGNIINMVGGLQSGAASSLLNSGQSLLSTGLSGYGQQASIATQQMQGWQQSIFGGGISDLAAGALGGAETHLGF